MALLTASERRILELAHEAQRGGLDPIELTDTVRRTMGQVPGVEFRSDVARLCERGLIRGHVRRKPGGELGRVVIEKVTPLGRSLITPRR